MSEIIRKYPLLFRRHSMPMSQTCMCWGIQIGKGWMPLIDDLCQQLQQRINDQLLPQVEFEEIKEKFGSLRITICPFNKEVEFLVRQTVNKARNTCESCGNDMNIKYYLDKNEYDACCIDCYTKYIE